MFSYKLQGQKTCKTNIFRGDVKIAGEGEVSAGEVRRGRFEGEVQCETKFSVTRDYKEDEQQRSLFFLGNGNNNT